MRNNLRNAFPEKSEKELFIIMKKFYRQLCDVLLESLYQHRITPEESIKRYTFKKSEVYDDLMAKNKDIICMTGHYANWEWSNFAWRQMPQRTLGVYKPLMNKMFDRYFVKSSEQKQLSEIAWIPPIDIEETDEDRNNKCRKDN